MGERAQDVPRHPGDLRGARPLPRGDDGRERPAAAHPLLDQAAHAVVRPVDVEEALEARDVGVAAEGPQGRGLALGQVEGLPAPGAAPAQARGLEGELRPLPPGRPRRRLVADGKGDPEGAAAEDGLDAVAAVNQVPGAEGVALRFSLFPPSSFAAARRRRRRRSRRRRPQRRLRQRRRRGGGGRSGGDISPRPLEGDGLRSGSAVLLCGSGGVVAVGAAVRSGGRDDGGDSGEGGRG